MSNTKLIAVLLVAVVASTAAWFAFFAKESAPDFTAYATGPDRKAAFFEYFQACLSYSLCKYIKLIEGLFIINFSIMALQFPFAT